MAAIRAAVDSQCWLGEPWSAPCLTPSTQLTGGGSLVGEVSLEWSSRNFTIFRFQESSVCRKATVLGFKESGFSAIVPSVGFHERAPGYHRGAK